MPRKPCSFDAILSQDNLILLTPGFSIRLAPSRLSAKLLRKTDACLPEYACAYLWGIGGMLSPVHLQGLEPQRMSCYAFFKWWLLLSLHPRCLRFKTPFVTLSIHFGTLTPVFVVLISRPYLTHGRPLPLSTGGRFRVGRRTRTKKGLQFLSVLYPADKLNKAILRHTSTGTSHRQIR